MIEIFHVSDLHFGKSNYRDKQARSLLENVNPLAKTSNNFLLVTGDFTDHGRNDEYDLAVEALKPCAGRIFVTPGNHDYGGGTVYDEGSAKYFDDPFAKTLGFRHPFFDKKVFDCTLQDSDNTLVVIGLNSCIKGDSDHHARGEIGDIQRNELKVMLDKYDASIPKILFLHHIPNRDAHWEHHMNLVDWEKLMEVAGGRVDVIAFGHQGSGLEVDSKAVDRPMVVRSFDGRSKGAGKLTWLLDADSSVAEKACYKITWKGELQLAEPTILRFGGEINPGFVSPA